MGSTCPRFARIKTREKGNGVTEESKKETQTLERTLHYFAPDGNYGSADGMTVIETTFWNEVDWDIIEQASDEDRPTVARLLTESYEPDRDDDFIKTQLVEKYGIDLTPFEQ